MSLAYGLLLVVLLVLAGRGPAARLLPDWRGVAGLAASLALGTAWVGLAQLVVSWLGLPCGFGVPAACALVSLGVFRGSTTVATTPGGEGEVPRGLAGAWLLVLVVAVGIGAGLPFKGDGGKFWGPKARELADHGVLEAPFLDDGTRLGFHRNYPLLAPALLAPVFGRGPVDAAAGPKLVLAAWLVALAVLLVGAACRAGSTGRGLAWLALGMPLLTSTDVREGVLSGGYLDALVALLVLLLVEGLTRLRAATVAHDAPAVTRATVLVVLAAGALANTKLEGAVWVACALGAAWLVGPARGRLAAAGLGALVLALPAAAVFAAAQGDPALADPALADVSRLLDPQTWLARGVPLLAGLAGVLLDASSFGLLPLGLVLAGWHHRRGLDGFTLALLLAVSAFLVVVYISTTMHLGRHLFTSAHRLVWHWLPALTLLVARAQSVASGRAS